MNDTVQISIFVNQNFRPEAFETKFLISIFYYTTEFCVVHNRFSRKVFDNFLKI